MNRRRNIKQLDTKNVKKKKRHSNRILLYIALILVAVLVFVVLSLTVFFKVENIQVSGSSQYDAQQIIDISGIEQGQNLILTSEDKAESLITKNLPYISSVTLKKKLPSTVTIVVEKAVPWVQVDQDNGYFLLDENLKVLEIRKKQMKNVPIIRGVTKHGKINNSAGETIKIVNDFKCLRLNMLKEIFDEAEAEGIDKITVIQIENVEDINITYDDKIVLQCGSSDNLDLKMKYAKRILAEKEHGGQSGILNLSRIPSEKQQAYFTACDLTEDQVSYSKESNGKKTDK